jgi:hypothetical protein
MERRSRVGRPPQDQNDKPRRRFEVEDLASFLWPTKTWISLRRLPAALGGTWLDDAPNRSRSSLTDPIRVELALLIPTAQIDRLGSGQNYNRGVTDDLNESKVLPHLGMSVPTARMNDSAENDSAKRALRDEIKRRVQWLSNDCSTYWRVRLEQSEWYAQNVSSGGRPEGLGGGNFVMAVALFSGMNFLAKAHRHLTKPGVFVSEKDREAVEDARSVVETRIPELKPVLKGERTRWALPQINACNEEAAFSALVKATLCDGVDIGIPLSEAGTIWKHYRNKLAHMGQPEQRVRVEVWAAEKPVANPREVIQGNPSFREEGGRWTCNVDRLSLDVVRIAEWLCTKVDLSDDAGRVRAALHWVFEDSDVLSPGLDIETERLRD